MNKRNSFLAIGLSTIMGLNGISAIPVLAEENTNIYSDTSEDASSDFSSVTSDVEKQFKEIEAEFEKQCSELIGNHSQLDSMLSINMDLTEMEASFETLKEEFDANLANYGTIDLFSDDEEASEISDSLDEQDEQADIDSDLSTYNSSGWITADSNSTNKKTSTQYKTQKAADSDYSSYQSKYKAAVKAFKSSATKDDLVDTSSSYANKVDSYETAVSNASESDSGDDSKTSILATPTIDGVVLSQATSENATSSSSTSPKKSNSN